jgi:hypothetical protein
MTDVCLPFRTRRACYTFFVDPAVAAEAVVEEAPRPATGGGARAFSLIEAMVAGVILLTLLTAVAAAVSHVADIVAYFRIKNQSYLVCQSHMEYLLAIVRERDVRADDCDPVFYEGDGRASDAGTFIATCRLVRGAPGPGATRLMVDVVAVRDGRPVQSQVATYVVDR